MCDDKGLGQAQAGANDDGRHYECLFCDTSFSRQASLVWHLKSIHKYVPDNKPACTSKSACDISGIDHNYHEKPSCSKCNKRLQNAYELEKHKCKAPKEMEKEEEEEQNETSENETEEPEITNCHICKKDFPSQEAYVKHINEFVSKYKPFYCCICQTTFARKRSMVFHLYIHKRSSEPDSKVSRLSDIILPTLPNLSASKNKKDSAKKKLNGRLKEQKLDDRKAAHKKSAVKKPGKEEQVSKDAPQIIDIRNTARSKQKCETCQRGFKSVLELETHMLKRHQAPLVHKCSLCPLSFVLKASLMNHAVSHIF